MTTLTTLRTIMERMQALPPETLDAPIVVEDTEYGILLAADLVLDLGGARPVHRHLHDFVPGTHPVVARFQPRLRRSDS